MSCYVAPMTEHLIIQSHDTTKRNLFERHALDLTSRFTDKSNKISSPKPMVDQIILPLVSPFT